MTDRRPVDRGRWEMAWYRAVATYDERFISEQVDCLVWEIYSLGGFERGFPPDLEQQLLHAFPDSDIQEPLPPDVLQRLSQLRDESENEVRARGWNPGPRLAAIRDEIRRCYAEG